MHSIFLRCPCNEGPATRSFAKDWDGMYGYWRNVIYTRCAKCDPDPQRGRVIPEQNIALWVVP